MDATTYTTYFYSPIGNLRITGTEAGISSILFCERAGASDKELPATLETCVQQLEEYFQGTRKTFDLPLLPQGTAFQRQVWEKLQTVAYGTTCSYMHIARAVSGEKAIRAVGAANGKNPISIVVPCHRVIGSDGSLTGYAGGLWRKEWLLRHEGVLKETPAQLSLF
ncbi:methylated-DNA--[protein]-cysteine S-methyltransferase [Pontibacter ruber]|uniref:Methylated-DNA--protein-cysteine methyltransferase n=1 Tax=Pontibacter ruber TaxID=1343895 RepID=A0ABW5CX52_9BACT|nr:methylated-DNA--[protein]-cysteine S-methyltransferase [Pontibacter ruber]